MKITIVGAGYVGFSLSVLMSKKHEVICLENDEEKINKIKNNNSPIEDKEIDKFLEKENLNLTATNDKVLAYKDRDYIIISTPTNYDSNMKSFDTKSVERVLSDIFDKTERSTVIIKSTIPLGFTEKMRKKFKSKKIIFSPEFLREGKALWDNLYPSRIVVGSMSNEGINFGKILLDCSNKDNNDVPIHYMNSNEAEAIKLFSNTYLAMRIAYFNELDTFCEINNLDALKVIEGVCEDSRIGNYYNNPSFGYGGYCLPKDTKQLLNEFENIPNELIQAIVRSNSVRKDYVAKNILRQNPKIVGIYRLIMKTGSDNFRESAILGIIERLVKLEVNIMIYEPMLKTSSFLGCKITSDIDVFKSKSDIIVSNRMDNILLDVKSKVYTRDIFNKN
tara:strand:- start:17411 stop:18583 length:1173 start_codon:yes stop_codon:yes gene_type:complete